MPKVLLIDTDLPLLELLQRKLEQEGFEVKVASSEHLQPFDPSTDLVILGEPSKEALLKRWLQTSRVPLIVIASGDEETLEVKGIPHLKLPFRPSELIELARRAMTLAV